MRKGNRMKAKVELLEILAEADKDVRNGRVAPIHDTFNNLRSILKERECSNEEYVVAQVRRKAQMACCTEEAYSKWVYEKPM